MPKPRKLSPASARIVPGTDMLKMIIIGAKILGRICFLSIVGVESPIATADCRYVFSFMLKTMPLNILEPPIPPVIPKIMIICHKPGPTIEIRTMRITKPGRHIKASTNLCTIRSNLPPIYPLMNTYQCGDNHTNKSGNQTNNYRNASPVHDTTEYISPKVIGAH